MKYAWQLRADSRNGDGKSTFIALFPWKMERVKRKSSLQRSRIRNIQGLSLRPKVRVEIPNKNVYSTFKQWCTDNTHYAITMDGTTDCRMSHPKSHVGGQGQCWKNSYREFSRSMGWMQKGKVLRTDGRKVGLINTRTRQLTDILARY